MSAPDYLFCGRKNWKQTIKLFVVHIMRLCSPQALGREKEEEGSHWHLIYACRLPGILLEVFQCVAHLQLSDGEGNWDSWEVGNMPRPQARKRNYLVPKQSKYWFPFSEHILTDNPKNKNTFTISLELILINQSHFNSQPHLGRHLATSGDIFGGVTGWGVTTGISKVEATDAAKHPIGKRTIYHNKYSPGPKCW